MTVFISEDLKVYVYSGVYKVIEYISAKNPTLARSFFPESEQRGNTVIHDNGRGLENWRLIERTLKNYKKNF